MHYQVEIRTQESGRWLAVNYSNGGVDILTKGNPTPIFSRERAEEIIWCLQTLGGDWESAKYRVVEIAADVNLHRTIGEGPDLVPFQP